MKSFSPNDDLPFVSVIMAVYNEQEVIVQKIESLFLTSYPSAKMEVRVGSDCSNDSTNAYLSELTKRYPSLYFRAFTERQGKKNIMNQLLDESKGEIIISTDANVIFDAKTIFELVKYFKNDEIGLVDSNMLHKGIVKHGISVQENAYISREVVIKNREGSLWGTMMGPFGGCFAVRKSVYSKVPAYHLMDDFYINMKVLEKGYMTMNNLNAQVFEDVSNQLNEEFRRKVRIAAGNFQNLAAFKHLLNPFKKGGYVNYCAESFCFISHKVLRWYGPFFMMLILISGIFLISQPLYQVLTGLYLFTYFLVIFDLLLKKINVHIVLLRFLTHFYSMNFALFMGFVKYAKGVKTNVWQPTKRNQSEQ